MGARTERGAHAFGGRLIRASELRVFQVGTGSQLINSGEAEPNRPEHPPGGVLGSSPKDLLEP